MTVHKEAHDWVRSAISHLSICDLGGADVNGTVRDLFPGWSYTSVDRRPGPGVDIVADAATWSADGRRFDAVVCCEVLEHAENWRAILANAARLLKPGGLLILTMAGPGREPHTCDGHPMPTPPTEYYGNIDPRELSTVLKDLGFAVVLVDQHGADVRATAKRPH